MTRSRPTHTAQVEADYQSCRATHGSRCIDPCDTSAEACIEGIDLTRECKNWDDMVENTPDACFTVIDCE